VKEKCEVINLQDYKDVCAILDTCTPYVLQSVLDEIFNDEEEPRRMTKKKKIATKKDMSKYKDSQYEYERQIYTLCKKDPLAPTNPEEVTNYLINKILDAFQLKVLQLMDEEKDVQLIVETLTYNYSQYLEERYKNNDRPGEKGKGKQDD